MNVPAGMCASSAEPWPHDTEHPLVPLHMPQDGLLPAAFMVGLLVSSPMFAEASKHHNAFRLIGLGLAVSPIVNASPSVYAREPEANTAKWRGCRCSRVPGLASASCLTMLLPTGANLQVWTVAAAGCGLAPGFGVLLVRQDGGPAACSGVRGQWAGCLQWR